MLDSTDEACLSNEAADLTPRLVDRGLEKASKGKQQTNKFLFIVIFFCRISRRFLRSRRILRPVSWSGNSIQEILESKKWSGNGNGNWNRGRRCGKNIFLCFKPFLTTSRKSFLCLPKEVFEEEASNCRVAKKSQKSLKKLEICLEKLFSQDEEENRMKKAKFWLIPIRKDK